MRQNARVYGWSLVAFVAVGSLAFVMARDVPPVDVEHGPVTVSVATDGERGPLEPSVRMGAVFHTKDELIAALREVAREDHDLLLVVGYEASDGTYQHLTAADLLPTSGN